MKLFKRSEKPKCTECGKTAYETLNGNSYCDEHYEKAVTKKWEGENAGVCPNCKKSLKNKDLKIKPFGRQNKRVILTCGFCKAVLGMADYDYASLGYL